MDTISLRTAPMVPHTLMHVEAVRPAAPIPRSVQPDVPATIRALRSNPITAFPEAAYTAQTLDIGRFRSIVLVNDPKDIEHIWSAVPTTTARAFSSSAACGPASATAY